MMIYFRLILENDSFSLSPAIYDGKIDLILMIYDAKTGSIPT